MPYAIRGDGSFIQVAADAELSEGETLYDDVPQWAYGLMAANELLANQTAEEVFWRANEMTFIANQLTAIEDADPTALPGSVNQWRDYRIKVRAWADGAENYPELAHRPVRPS